MCEKSQAQIFCVLARKHKAGTIVPALLVYRSLRLYCALASSVVACGVGVTSAVAPACTARIA
jgi:hypothetical protein